MCTNNNSAHKYKENACSFISVPTLTGADMVVSSFAEIMREMG